jgi:hypothetical protein
VARSEKKNLTQRAQRTQRREEKAESRKQKAESRKQKADPSTAENGASDDTWRPAGNRTQNGAHQWGKNKSFSLKGLPAASLSYRRTS